MVDQLPTVGGDSGPLEALPVTLFASGSGAAVPVSSSNPLPVAVISGGGSGGGGGAVTIADGADLAEGATTDAVVAAGAAGSASAKLRRLTTDLAAFATANHADLIAPTPAGTNKIGGVTIADGDNVAMGAKADAAATNSTGSWSVVALLKGLYALLAGVLTFAQAALTTSVNRSRVIGFTGTVISTATTTTITVTTAPTLGTIEVGNIVVATGVPTGATIASLGTGTGGTGTYVISSAATATATGITMTSVGPSLLAAANTARKFLVGQGKGVIAFNEFGGAPVVQGLSSYDASAGSSFSVSTSGAVNVIASAPATLVTATEG